MNTVVTIAGRVAGMASLLLLLGIGGCHQATAPEVAGGSVGLKQGQVQPRAVDGGKQPAVKPDLTQPLNVEENPPFVPVGPARGKMAPQNKASRNEAIKSGKEKSCM